MTSICMEIKLISDKDKLESHHIQECTLHLILGNFHETKLNGQ